MPKDTDLSNAYSISRKLVMESSNDYNKSVLLDIHRDVSTENSEGNFMRIVLGKNNPNFNENSKFANSLLQELRKVYEIKADILIKEQGTYNQDLSAEQF